MSGAAQVIQRVTMVLRENRIAGCVAWVLLPSASESSALALPGILYNNLEPFRGPRLSGYCEQVMEYCSA